MEKVEKRNRETLRNKRVCRFCLKDDEPLTSIFDRSIKSKNTVPLALQIMACVSIEVFPSDGMPSTICQVCRYFMDQSYRFKQICRQGDEALRHYIVHGELRTPIPWPQDLVKNIPEELLATASVQVAVEEELTEEENEIEVPFEAEDLEQISPVPKKIRKKKTPAITIKESTAKRPTLFTVSTENEEGEESEILLNFKTEEQPTDLVEETDDTGNQAFPCDMCHHSFPLKQLLDLHRKNHLRKRSHKCPLCNKTFFTKYDLQYHLMTHSGVKPYECVICHKTFSRISLLRRHEKIHRTVTKYVCGQCDSVFLSANFLHEHIERKHSTEKPHKCDKCNKSFTFKQGLERHAMSHNKVLPFQCNYCPESFMVSNQLQRHVQKHAGHRPYLCKFCPKTFLLSHHYTRHLRTKHIGEEATNPIRKKVSRVYDIKTETEQLKCAQCDVSFDKQDDLLFHSAIHATEDLTCPLCKETFEDVEEVVVHIKSHIEGEQFMCEWCDLVFTSEEKLDTHIDNHHIEIEDNDATTEDMMDISFLEQKSQAYKEQVEKENKEKGTDQEEVEEDEEECSEEETEEEDEDPQSQGQNVSILEKGDESGAITVQNADDSVVLEWAASIEPSTEDSVQPSNLPQVMVVGGGETLVYQIGADEQNASNVDTTSKQTPNASPVSVDLQLSKPSVAQVVPVPITVTPDSSQPVYTELQTVDNPFYTKEIRDAVATKDLVKTPTRKTTPIVKQSTPTASITKQATPVAKQSTTPTKTVAKPTSPTKTPNEKRVKETKTVTFSMASILQKAEEVKQQKQRLDELKMLARQKRLQESGGLPLKKRSESLRGEDDGDASEPETTQTASETLPSPKLKEVTNSGGKSPRKEIADSRHKEIDQREKVDPKKLIQKTISFSRKSSESTATTAQKAIKKLPEKPAKVEPSKQSETPPRSGEKSLQLLERDIMELKKNAGQKTSTSNAKPSSRFIGTKVSRHSLNPGPKPSLSFLKNMDPPIESNDPDLPKLPQPPKVSRLKTLAKPIPIKPIKKQKTSAESPKKDSDESKKEEVFPAPVPSESSKSPSGGDSPPRRSRRASKIKDYAAMIRDNTISESEEEEDGDVASSSKDVSGMDSMDYEDSDDDIDVNEEVLIHRSTPAPKRLSTGNGKKRGRPRKHPLVEDGPTPAKIPKMPVLESPARRNQSLTNPVETKTVTGEVRLLGLESSIKKKRGRPSKAMLKAKEEANNAVFEESSPKRTVVANNRSTSSPVLVPSQINKIESGSIIMSPAGQTLKKVQPAQLIKSLPPGVKALPLPSSVNTIRSPMGQVSEMKIGPKTVRVQKILMTKSQLQAMAEKGLVEIKDGAMVLKPGVKIPSSPIVPTKAPVKSDVPPTAAETPTVESELADETTADSSQSTESNSQNEQDAVVTE